MPELPDLVIQQRILDRHAIGRRVREVHVPAARILRETSPQTLGRRLHGRRLQESRRHGKYLFARIEGDGWLVLHFGMTGRLAALGPDDAVPEHTDLLMRLEPDADTDRLVYVAPRKLGRVAISDDPAQFAADHDLGPDLLALDRAAFIGKARGRRGQVKCWLMDQSALAGLGNVYSDESLYRAGIHPRTPLPDLDDDALARLFEAIHAVIESAVEAGADPARMPGDFLLPHRGQAGAACPRCGGAIAPVDACGRTAWHCPACQPAPD